MRKSQDGKVLFAQDSKETLKVFETSDEECRDEENETGQEIANLDTFDTEDSYMVAVASENSNFDVFLYSLKKDLKSKQLQLVRKYSSGLDGDFIYRTVKISSNSHIAFLATNDDNEESRKLNFQLLDQSQTNKSTVISWQAASSRSATSSRISTSSKTTARLRWSTWLRMLGWLTCLQSKEAKTNPTNSSDSTSSRVKLSTQCSPKKQSNRYRTL